MIHEKKEESRFNSQTTQALFHVYNYITGLSILLWHIVFGYINVSDEQHPLQLPSVRTETLHCTVTHLDFRNFKFLFAKLVVRAVVPFVE